MTVKHVTSQMEAGILEHGWSGTLASNNELYSAKSKFKQATEEMGVSHITSSPQYHQSNKLAKRYV